MSIIGIIAGVFTIIAISGGVAHFCYQGTRTKASGRYIVFAGKLENSDHSINEAVRYLEPTNSLSSYSKR